MLTHFQFKPLFNNSQMPGWHISFYFKKEKYNAIYHKDGSIEWTSNSPSIEYEKSLKDQIHELMLFHVYDQ